MSFTFEFTMNVSINIQFSRGGSVRFCVDDGLNVIVFYIGANKWTDFVRFISGVATQKED